MIEIKRQKIYLDGAHVGFFHQFRTEDVELRSILGMFDSACVEAICRLNLPKKLNYTWISDIAVKPEWRRQGIARKVVEGIALPNTLVACAPGSGSKGHMRMNHTERLAFYRDLGFSIVVGTKHDYAFYYGKKEN